MAEQTLIATPVLDGFNRSIGGTNLRARTDLSLVALACPLGGEVDFSAALFAGYGLKRPDPQRASPAGDLAALQLAPDQVTLVMPSQGPAADRHVAERMGGTAYATEQTDAWVVFDLEGNLALPALERLCPLDLHPDAFPEGAYGRSLIEHMSGVVWCLGPQHYRLMSASSSAASFAHALETSLTYVA